MAKLLRTDLPDEVWDRLAAEAASHGMKIGVYAKQLFVARDARRITRDERPADEARR